MITLIGIEIMNTQSLSKIIFRMITALCLVAVTFSLGSSVHAKPSGAITFPGINAFQQIAAGTGWILFDGKLYWTKDDGVAWRDITPSQANIQAVDFLDSSHGWTITSDGIGFSLAWTTDGGDTWQSRGLVLPGLARLDAPIAQVFMDWRTNVHGWLVFKLATGNNFSRGILFVTTDGGITWAARDIPLGEPVTFTDEDHGWVFGGPAGNQTFRTQDGGISWKSTPDNGDHETIQNEQGFVERSMSTPGMGWAKWQSGECTGGVCVREVKLLRTNDGVHWEPMQLPNGQTSLRANLTSILKSSFADPDTIAYVGQGFDTCEIPILAQMQIWWNRSPYNAVNLYIGGISRACSNLQLSSSFLSTLNAQGWRFIPTWVGPQAACAPAYYPHKMSTDESTAYTQGVTEANEAIAAAQALGLTEVDGSGTVIYYDLEAYSIDDPVCRAAANAFINGWTHQLHSRGNLAGVYGASYSSAVSDWWSIPNVPDAVWIANWYGSAGMISFTPDATVFGAFGLDDNLWPTHQRLRQYAGGHDETWGGLTINIDSDVLDGPLAVPNGTGGVSVPSAPSSPVPANGATLARTKDIWLFWKTNGDTCSVHIWGGALDTTVSAPCSLHHLGMQDPGSYSWQVTATNAMGSTAGPTWHFNIRPAAPTGLTALAVSATRVDLTWTASRDTVDNYLVYADGTQVASVAGTATSYQVQNLKCKTTHSFYVKAVREGIQSIASNTASATTTSCAPVLVSPVGGLATSLQPEFTWQAVDVASQYQIQVSVYSNFSTLTVNTKTSETSHIPALPLIANKLYYWRVRALGAFSFGDWGKASFTTPNPPPAPMLVSPTNNSLVTDTTPRFDWRDVTAPTGTMLHYYQIQVAADSTFTNPLQDTNVTASEFTPLTRLSPNTTYYWRVRSVNTLGHSSAWCAVWSFRTAIRPPILVSPANGTTLTDLSPSFDWKDVTGASSYSLQISTTLNFTSLLVNVRTLGSSYSLPFNLPANMTLYWRVRANGVNGPSLWSARWSFRMSSTAR